MGQMLFRGSSLANTARVVEASRLPPAGFRWDFNAYPLNISGTGRSFGHDFVPESYHRTALSGPTYYVDGVSGNDGNTGLTSYANAVKTISVAITKGNAAAVPFNVLVKPGTYYRANGFNGITPTQKVVFMADGGRVNVGTFDNLTFALDGTYTNTYSCSRSNVNRVFDLLNHDVYGNYVELTNVATPTLCNTTPGSWAQSGSTLYVRRTDGAAVTSANTRAPLGTVSNISLTAPIDLLLTGTTTASGFDIEGGGFGVISSLVSGAANIMANNCSFRYAGGILGYTNTKAVRIDNLNGLVAFVNCDASCNADDGFNLHNSSGSFISRMLTINCTANNNGRGNSLSNNGLTAHETCQVIDINGSYDANYGGNIHIINQSQAWLVGTRAQRSFGDASLGGTVSPCEFITADTAEMWLDSTMAAANPGGAAINAFTTASKVHKHKHVSMIGAETPSSGATIDTY